MKRFLGLITKLSFILISITAQSEEFNIHSFPGYPSCDLQAPDGPKKAFRCCVIAADTIAFSEFPQLTTLRIRSNLCPYPELQEITFRLEEVTSSGIHVYEWYQPALDATPFVSPNGLQTRGWMSFYPHFQLGQPAAGDKFKRFIDSRLAIEEQELPGLFNRLFTAELDSDDGWKMINKEIVNQREFSEPCPRFPQFKCNYRTTTLDQTWQNTQDSSQKETRRVSFTERI